MSKENVFEAAKQNAHLPNLNEVSVFLRLVINNSIASQLRLKLLEDSFLYTKQTPISLMQVKKNL